MSDESGYQSRMKNITDDDDDDDEDIVDEGDEDEYNEAGEDDDNNEIKNDYNSDIDDDDGDQHHDDDDSNSSDSSPEIKRPRFSSNRDVEEESKNSKNKLKANKNELNRKSMPESYKDDGKMNFAEKYMAGFGYKRGRGLGKKEDGIVEPIQTSDQRGKRGLGYMALNLKKAASKYNPEECKVSVDEEINWLPNNYSESFNKKLLESWMKMGPPLECITDESLFCSADVINEILSGKNALSAITPNDMKNGRTRSNPFETISKGIFLNRAAMKMANMDAVLDWMFTDPRNSDGNKVIGPEDLLYFADVCAGPGGFSEYVLYRKGWRAKGFGFTLRQQNDFKLDEFIAGSSETFEPHYGAEGDGNVYLPQNLISFRDHVLKYTDGKGVHFMMADGGIEITTKINDQELICKKLYLCQCLMALLIVRTEGHFVVKLFDLFTSFSVGLVYLMYRCFKSVLIIKPNTSRPANSERYLVCKWKRADCGDITSHLFEINKKVPPYEGKGDDVLTLVPDDELQKDREFYNYITSSNKKIGENQIANLKKLAAFSEDLNLREPLQPELRKKCLEKWNIPVTPRPVHNKCDARTKWNSLFSDSKILESKLSDNKIDSLISFRQEQNLAINNWYSLVISGEEQNNNCAFYLGLGRENVYKYVDKKWVKWNEGSGMQSLVGFSLPPDSLVYGELVAQFIGEGRSQRRTYCFHIIDGIHLGNENIRCLPFLERSKACKLFAKSLTKANFSVSVKNHVPLKDLDSLFRGWVLKSIKGVNSVSNCIPLDENTFWRAGGVMLIRDICEPWSRHLSSNRGEFYVYKKNKNKPDTSIYESNLTEDQKKNVYASFDYSFFKRHIWWCDPEYLATLGDKNL